MAWLALTGQPVEGFLSGTSAEPLQSHLSFWFFWKDYYHYTQVYGQ